MKKFICLFTVALMAVFGMTARANGENSRFLDNMSLTLKGGVTTPIKNSPFWGGMRPVVGIEVFKSVTPVLSLGVEGTWSINTSPQWFGMSNGLVFDRQQVGGLMKVNMMNAINGNREIPRTFELSPVVGIGWQHDYFKNNSVNSMYTKFGLDFDFNLGVEKVWTVSFKPDIAFNLGESNIKLNRNLAFLEFWAGITYHFKNHDGSRFFHTNDNVYTQSYVDGLNREANSLREALEDCKNQPVKVVEKIVYVETPTCNTDKVEDKPLEVHFMQGSAVIDNASRTALKEFVKGLGDNNEPKVIVKGFASEEGSKAFNQTLSLKRAVAVKDALVGFGLRPSQVDATGFGATTEFGKTLESNRVVVVVEK